MPWLALSTATATVLVLTICVCLLLHFSTARFTATPQVPIDEKRAINRFCLIRNFATNPAFDFMARE
jgi:hypothetical protein